MDAVKSVQSTGMKKSFGNSPAFGGKKMSDKGITSPAMDSKKSASAFTMKGSVDSNKMYYQIPLDRLTFLHYLYRHYH